MRCLQFSIQQEHVFLFHSAKCREEPSPPTSITSILCANITPIRHRAPVSQTLSHGKYGVYPVNMSDIALGDMELKK